MSDSTPICGDCCNSMLWAAVANRWICRWCNR